MRPGSPKVLERGCPSAALLDHERPTVLITSLGSLQTPFRKAWQNPLSKLAAD